MTVKEIRNTKIEWEKHGSHERFFFHYQGDTLFLLRLNDFPDEPLYTIINGLEILDFDDIPVLWQLERGA
jgi:hypothetical protein